MINFIIYDDNNEVVYIYKNIIRNIMNKKNLSYSIYEVSKYSEDAFRDIRKISGKKIYLLNFDKKTISGLDLARNIRKSGDWISQIIATTSFDENKYIKFSSGLLILDFISKFGNFDKDIYFTLETAISILDKRLSLSFKSNSKVFQILYDDICYIEKNLNYNDSTIITKSNSYTIKSSINKLYEVLNNDSRFFKTHRSCIVNINNITSFDMKNSIIKFNSMETNLVSRDKKKELKDKILERNGIF
jgi:two-component system response regulator AgrA